MISLRFYLLLILTLLVSCSKNEGNIIYNRTCVTTQHHDLIIGDMRIYVKYHGDNYNFPGWVDLAEYDTSFTTNSVGYGCIDNLPTGKHWVVGLGKDTSLQLPIKGRMFVNITFEQPELDTILYVGEELRCE